jgi:ribonuclease R
VGASAHPVDQAYSPKNSAPRAGANKGSGKAKASEPTPELKPPRRSGKAEPVEAYRASDAAAKNAELRKSREMKKSLLSEAKGNPGGAPKATEGKAPTKHRKGPPKSGARKPKAKP